MAGSLAIDAVTDTCPADDQRGVDRPQDGDLVADCDIGAYELAPLLCNGLVPTRVGTPGNDANLRGTNGPDVIHGLGGADSISGLNDNDVICGGEGNDTLSGNNGIDRLFGENGTDTLNGNNGNDALDGGGGTDTCNGGSGSDSRTACESVTSIP